MTENKTTVGIGEFVRNAIALSDDEFEFAMKLDNDDESIDEVDMITLTEDAIKAYERS